jgi:hypothetical protein
MTAGSEARFTPPRPDCPHPEWWTSTDVDSTECEVTALVAALVVALQPELVIETGTAFGQTAEAVGHALAVNGHGRLVTLETEPERVCFSRNRCEGLPVTVLEMSSLDYTPDGPVDFAWFDSLTDLRHEEYLRYLPYLSCRAVAGWHDTGPQHVVRGYLDRLVTAGTLPPPLYLPTPRGVCFARIEGSR